jgi:hypothetical protein
MAAFSDIMELQFQARLADGQAVRNTLHFRRNPSAGSVDATWLTALLGDANTTTLTTAYRAILPTTARLDGLLARAARDPLFPNDDRDEAFLVIDAAGTRAAPATLAPDELTATMKLSGDLAGRRWRGRIWLPPAQDVTVISGEQASVGSTWFTNCLSFAAQLRHTLYTDGGSHYGGQWNDCDMVVYSRRGRSLDETYYARVASLGVPTKLRWLRSRNPTLA